MKILVCGGAGYIGSCTTQMLLDEGYSVVVYDNLSKGLLRLVDERAEFVEADILDEQKLDEVFGLYNFDAVIHFAALKDAGESMRDPIKYSENIKGTINILNAMVKYGVKKIIFSSSASVYGEPKSEIVDEKHPVQPINFYGFTKMKAEKLFDWYAKLKGINYVSLRYFNLAGDTGKNYIDPNAKNIFPIIAETAIGLREKVEIFGSDYDTHDGTGIRDYIHVIDLSRAHIMALKLQGSEIINLGSSSGYSVFELIKGFERISGKKIKYEIVERRLGDPAKVVASNQKAKIVLGWEPELGLDEMIESTWRAYLSYKK